MLSEINGFPTLSYSSQQSTEPPKAYRRVPVSALSKRISVNTQESSLTRECAFCGRDLTKTLRLVCTQCHEYGFFLKNIF